MRVKSTMRELAKWANWLAGTDMKRRTYWRPIAGGKRWSLLLLTQGQEGEPPEPPAATAPRINPEWLVKTGDGLKGEDLLHLRITERLRARQQHESLTLGEAASIATTVCAEMVREGLDLR
jgi:hypothetical protein